MTRQTTALIAVAALVGSDAFLAPATCKAPARASTQMSASGNLKKAAASVLAGVVGLGSVLSPADASLFGTPDQTVQTQEVGFGMPDPSKDPKNNNAASGKENGPKYDPKQYGQFAKENSVSSIDYGSAKGTDFGKTAGTQKGVATEKKATDGDYLADAKQNTREGVQIADKNTADAANVDFSRDVSQQKRGSGSLNDGIQAAKDVITGGTRSSNGNTAKASSTLTSGINLGGAGDAIKDKADEVAKSTQDLRDPNVDASLQGKSPDVGGLFGTDPKGQADQVGRKTANKVKSDINTASNAAQGNSNPFSGFFGGNKNSAGNAANQAGQAVKNKVGSDVRTAQNAAPNSLSDAGQAIKDKVQNAAPDNLGDAGQTIKNKVDSGVRTAQNAAPNSGEDAGRAVKNKVGSDVRTAKNAVDDATPNNLLGKVQRDINTVTNQDSSPDGIANRAQDLLTSQIDKSKSTGNNLGELGNNAQKTVRNAQDNANNAVQNNAQEAKNNLINSGTIDAKSPASTLLSANNIPGAQKDGNVGTGGGLFGINSQQQAQTTGSKTVDKVQQDIDTARANKPFQGGTTTSYDAIENAADKLSGGIGPIGGNNGAGNAANQAGQAVKNKVGSDVRTAKNAANNAAPSFNPFGNNNNGAGNAANQAGQAVKNKVGSDVRTAKNAANNAAPSFGNFGNNNNNVGDAANQAGRAIKNKVGSDVRTARNAANQAGNSVSSAPKQWEYGQPRRAVANKVNSDINNTKQFTGYVQKEAKQAGRKASNVASNANTNTPSIDLGGIANSLTNNNNNSPNGFGADTSKSFANQPDGQKAGGLFSTNPKGQADVTGRKTVEKVSNDVNTLKKGLLN